jgi:hypothetical protein
MARTSNGLAASVSSEQFALNVKSLPRVVNFPR